MRYGATRAALGDPAGVCHHEHMTITLPQFLLGHYMRLSMDSAGLTVEDMAERMGVSRTTVSRWLNNRSEPRRGELLAWAQLTDVPVWWLQNERNPRQDGDGGSGAIARPEGLEPPTFCFGACAVGHCVSCDRRAWAGILDQLQLAS